MPLAVTHVLLTIILVDIFRDYIIKHKKYFTLHTILIAGIAGLLPDIDVLVNPILGFFGHSFELLKHGGITHTLVFGLVFLIPAVLLWKKQKHKTAMYFFVICFGILFHIFLDGVLGGGAWEGIMLFWPITDQAFKIHLFSSFGISNMPVLVDTIVLLAWLWHEEIKHKIRDFI